MGLYERDPNFEEHFKVGDRFVITGLEYNGPINTRFGQAEKVTISVVTADSYPNVVTYSALGAGFANLARRATAGDFPHVAEYITVPLPGGKAVKRFAPVYGDDGRLLAPRAFVEGEHGQPIDLSEYAPQGAPDEGQPPVRPSNLAGF